MTPLCDACGERPGTRVVLLPARNKIKLCVGCIKPIYRTAEPIELGDYNGSTHVQLVVRRRACPFCGGAGETDWGVPCSTCEGVGSYPLFPLRGLVQIDPDRLMHHAHAGVAWVEARSGFNAETNAELNAYAFLSVFHPDLTHQQKQELSRRD